MFFIVKIDFLRLNLLSNRAVERFWNALWLGIRPFSCFCLVGGSCARVLCASLVHRLVRQKQIILPNTVKKSLIYGMDYETKGGAAAAPPLL